jgi:hypothetical protein
MRLIRFHTISNQELVFLTMGVLRRALRWEQPDQHVIAIIRSLPIWQSSSKRGNLLAWAPQVQSSANTPIIIYLYPAKSLILWDKGALAKLLVQFLYERFLRNTGFPDDRPYKPNPLIDIVHFGILQLDLKGTRRMPQIGGVWLDRRLMSTDCWKQPLEIDPMPQMVDGRLQGNKNRSFAKTSMGANARLGSQALAKGVSLSCAAIMARRTMLQPLATALTR